MNLDAYFRRIAYAGPTAPTLETLEALCLAHVRAIPFENLDVLLGRGIDLSDEAVDHKLITLGRGGYCFEHNPLFLRVLTRLGFRAHAISARVRLQRPREFTPPRTHCFIALELDNERWLADVGVGGLSPTAPLRLDTDGEQPTPHEPRRIVREGALLFHQVKLGDAWHDVCEFTLEAMPPVDREVGNWFTSSHPNSHFRNRLLAARALDDGGRVTLLNQELTLRPRHGAPQVTRLGSPDALLAALELELFSHLVDSLPVGVIVLDANGPGIPPEQRERVFEKFVRRCVRRRRPGGGALFRVRLPVTPPRPLPGTR